jgi:hypothetical protein
MRTIRATVIAVTAMVMVVCTAVRANVLEQIPSDALVVIKVNNLQQASQRISAFSQQLGLAQMVPQFADPLGALTDQMEIEQGLRRDGDMAIVIMHPEAAGADRDDDEPAILVILPISDYDQFLQNFEDRQADGDISEVTVGEDDEPAFIIRRGQYAALSPYRAVLEKQADGMQVRGLASRQMDERDIVAYANFEAIRPHALPAIQMGREMFMAQLQQGMQQQDAQFQPIAQAMVDNMMNIVERFINETEAGTLGLSFVERGINTTLMAQFQEGTEFAKAVGQIRNSNESLLRGLPQQQYLMFGGSAQDPEAAEQLLEQIIAPFRQDLQALGEPGQPMLQYLDAMKRFQSSHRQASFGMIAPRGALGQEALIQAVNIFHGDARAMREAQREMFQTQEAMMQLFNPAMAQADTTFTSDAREVDGVSLDRFQTRFEFQARTPEEAQAAQALAMMYGPDGLNGYSGIVENDRLVTITGGGDELIRSAIQAARAGQEPMAQRVQAVAGQLPAERAMVMYFSVDVAVQTVLTYARNFGFAVPVQIPPDLPPIGMTAGSEENALRMDSHVPTQLVQSLVAAGMQVYMQMMQGAFQPGPGGL